MKNNGKIISKISKGVHLVQDDKVLDIRSFFPIKGLLVQKINITEDKITIKLQSETTSCECPKCNEVSHHGHGTYVRYVQDLPIFGRNVMLEINAHEYYCDNDLCVVGTVAESFNGFVNHYSRMTERLEDFICSFALETSCEGCSRICKMIGINISGDSIIRLLLKRFEHQPELKCNSIVGVDDFAFKKRHNYGTIVVDDITHKTVAIMNGRDGEELRKWLRSNKHIKMITRDRASAFAKVITEELPDVMQIADRFHLHQNLLEVIKKVLDREIPATVVIPNCKELAEKYKFTDMDNDSKKNGIRNG